MRTAHIIPRSVLGKIVLGLMGQRDIPEDGQDILWDNKNGLPMWVSVERTLDQGRTSIVPLTRFEDGSADRLKVVVLDKMLFSETHPDDDLVKDMNNKHGTISTFRELHDPELIFKTTTRPA